MKTPRSEAYWIPGVSIKKLPAKKTGGLYKTADQSGRPVL
jgi:hypothetical protein